MDAPSGGVDPSAKAGSGLFKTTHWSVVLAASDPGSPRSAQALEELCRSYWYPLYACIRREGYRPADAEDLTQSFLARLLTGKGLAHVAPEKGKFRSFLLACLRHFLSDQRRRANALKRGSAVRFVTFDVQGAEERFQVEAGEALDSSAAFDREWGVTLLAHALSRLRREYEAAGKLGLYEHLKYYAASEMDAAACTRGAVDLNLTETAAKAALHRLRQRYRELTRSEIAQTVATPDQIDEEIRYLIEVVSR
jgi:DNA-directed RNA polymerase specialized sigma24 family protein